MANTNTKYSCLIVDDNKVARLLLTQLISQIPTLSLKGECANAMEASAFFAKDNVDILFLDIEMPEVNGFELLKSLRVRPITILTSANKGYAEEAFTLNVADYIVKPVALPRLMMAVQRSIELVSQTDSEVQEIEKKYVFIKENKILKKLLLSDVYIFESKGDYVKILLADKYHIVHSTLKTLEERLPARFIKVHRSYIVAIDKIDYMEDNVLYLNNVPVPVSESCKNDLIAAMNLL